MLRLNNFVITPGNRPGQKRVYARLSDGTLRRVKDPDVVRAVLLRHATQGIRRPRWYTRLWRWLLAKLGR